MRATGWPSRWLIAVRRSSGSAPATVRRRSPRRRARRAGWPRRLGGVRGVAAAGAGPRRAERAAGATARRRALARGDRRRGDRGGGATASRRRQREPARSPSGGGGGRGDGASPRVAGRRVAAGKRRSGRRSHQPASAASPRAEHRASASRARRRVRERLAPRHRADDQDAGLGRLLLALELLQRVEDQAHGRPSAREAADGRTARPREEGHPRARPEHGRRDELGVLLEARAPPSAARRVVAVRGQAARGPRRRGRGAGRGRRPRATRRPRRASRSASSCDDAAPRRVAGAERHDGGALLEAAEGDEAGVAPRRVEHLERGRQVERAELVEVRAQRRPRERRLRPTRARRAPWPDERGLRAAVRRKPRAGRGRAAGGEGEGRGAGRRRSRRRPRRSRVRERPARPQPAAVVGVRASRDLRGRPGETRCERERRHREGQRQRGPDEAVAPAHGRAVGARPRPPRRPGAPSPAVIVREPFT